jgi:transcription initiation factor IIE alpha subunit
MQEQIIPCPVCQTKIPFDLQSLLRGVCFTCPSCYASIGLSKDAVPTVEDAVKKLNDLKQQIKSGKS